MHGAKTQGQSECPAGAFIAFASHNIVNLRLSKRMLVADSQTLFLWERPAGIFWECLGLVRLFVVLACQSCLTPLDS